MSSPFINYASGGSSGGVNTVNNIKPNLKGNVVLPLSKLSDCSINTPSSSQVLFYNGSNWINESVSGFVPVPNLFSDHDVNLTSTQDKDILSFDYSSQKWINRNVLDSTNIPSLVNPKSLI